MNALVASLIDWAEAIRIYRSRGLRPTGECFYHALQFFARFDFAPGEVEQHRLVHGIVMNPLVDEPQPIAHAWVERDDITYEPVLLPDGHVAYAILSRHMLQTALRMTERRAYTFEEALANNARTNTFGPWEPRYFELCRPPNCKQCGDLLKLPLPVPATGLCSTCGDRTADRGAVE